MKNEKNALKAAVDVLSRRPLSEKELSDKLLKKGFEEEEVQKVIEHLRSLALLDDEEYAGMVVRHYAAMGYGEMKVRSELYRRGLGRDIIECMMQDFSSDPDKIYEIMRAKIKVLPPDAKEKKRIFDMMLRKGYMSDDIRDALSRISADMGEDDGWQI